MIVTIDTASKTFQRTFTGVLLLAAAICFATAAYSWTEPSSSPPGSNVAAPINTSTESQVKDGALSVDGLSVYGSQYIQNNLGIGTGPSSAWGIYTVGSQGGVYGQATDGQAIRGYSASGYGGYFIGQGGVYAQNHAGYYAFLSYPGSSWTLYTNGNTYTAGYSRADGGFCIGGSCKTSWTVNTTGSTWEGGRYGGWGGSEYVTDCPGGYIMTGIRVRTGNMVDQIAIRCGRVY